MITKTKVVCKICQSQLSSSPSTSSSSSESQEVYITPSPDASCYTSKDESKKGQKRQMKSLLIVIWDEKVLTCLLSVLTIREPCMPQRIIAGLGNSCATSSIMDKGKQKMAVDVDVNKDSHFIHVRVGTPDFPSAYFCSQESRPSAVLQTPTVEGGYSMFATPSPINALPSHVTVPSQVEGSSSRLLEQHILTASVTDSSHVSAVCCSTSVTTLDFGACVITSGLSSSTYVTRPDLHGTSAFTKTRRQLRPTRNNASKSATSALVLPVILGPVIYNLGHILSYFMLMCISYTYMLEKLIFFCCYIGTASAPRGPTGLTNRRYVRGARNAGSTSAPSATANRTTSQPNHSATNARAVAGMKYHLSPPKTTNTNRFYKRRAKTNMRIREYA